MPPCHLDTFWVYCALVSVSNLHGTVIQLNFLLGSIFFWSFCLDLSNGIESLLNIENTKIITTIDVEEEDVEFLEIAFRATYQKLEIGEKGEPVIAKDFLFKKKKSEDVYYKIEWHNQMVTRNSSFSPFGKNSKSKNAGLTPMKM